MTAPDSAPAALEEVEWHVHLAPSYGEAQRTIYEQTGVRPMKITSLPVVGYRALNELLKGQLKGHVSKIEYKAVDGRWRPVRTGKLRKT